MVGKHLNHLHAMLPACTVCLHSDCYLIVGMLSLTLAHEFFHDLDWVVSLRFETN
jgi:hypothetical protein